jgi:hypothetical protein
MTTKRVLGLALVTVTATAALAIGGAEAAGFFKEATASGYTSGVTAMTSVKRSLPNGRTDIIKAMGNNKWGDIELK